MSESGFMARFQSVGEKLDFLAEKLEGMDLRSRESEIRTRESLVELRGSVAHLRDLLDAMAREHANLRADVKALDERTDKLEAEVDRHKGSAIMTAGSGAVGGGMIYGFAELVQRVLT